MACSVSIVVPTVDRGEVVRGLFRSLVAQDRAPLEVIVVDQNDDDRILDVMKDFATALPLKHLRTSGRRGISAAKNTGWRAATGELVGFADDDCWYPPNYISYAEDKLHALQVAALTGRAADESGRSINGRYAPAIGPLTRATVWTGGIEWVGVFSRAALDAVGGFDERIGVGAQTRWQSTEGQDLLLRLLDRGYGCVFDPQLIGHHREIRGDHADSMMRRRGRAYGRGMGFVLAKHGVGLPGALYRAGRPLASAALAVAAGDFGGSGFHLNVALGRLEGWMDGLADRRAEQRHE